MRPLFGFPRMVVFPGAFASVVTLEDGAMPQIAVSTLKHWVNALLITENYHCFKIIKMEKGRNLTPWYLRGWCQPSCVAFHCKACYCPQLSFDNVYPLLWRAIDIASCVSISLCNAYQLGEFTTTSRIARFGDGGPMSQRMKKRLKGLVENRMPLREFFVHYIEIVRNYSMNSPYVSRV